MKASTYQIELKSVEGQWLDIRGVDTESMTYEVYDCDSGETKLIPACEVEGGEAQLKRIYYQNRTTVRCGNCGGSGYKWVDEGPEYGPPVQDACYHCGNTGDIDRNTWQQDRIQQAASVIADEMTQNEIRSANSNPDGEGFAFHAAENGMREYEYRQACHFNNEGRASEALKAMADVSHSALNVIVERFAPAPKPKWEVEVWVTWNTHNRGENRKHFGKTVVFDEPTESYLVESTKDKWVWVHQSMLEQIDQSQIPTEGVELVVINELPIEDSSGGGTDDEVPF